MTDTSPLILFERYPLNEGQGESVRSGLFLNDSRWVARLDWDPPTGSVDLATAIGQITAAQFAPCSMLRISTDGLVAPTEIAQALTAWIEPEETLVADLAAWCDDEGRAVYAWQELEQHYADSEARMLSDRFIMIDDQPCAVICHGDLRAAVVFDHDDDPEYSEPWVVLGLHNGWGWSRHTRGLVAPDIECELHDHEGLKHLRLARTREMSTDDRLRDLLNWADSLLQNTPEHRGTRLMVDRHGRFTTSEDEYVDVSEGFDPALWAKRTGHPVLGDDVA